MKQTIILTLVLSSLFILTSTSARAQSTPPTDDDAWLTAFTAEIDTLAKEIAAKFETSPGTPGITASRTILDDKRDLLNDRMKMIREDRFAAANDKVLAAVMNGYRLISATYIKNVDRRKETADTFIVFQHFLDDYVDAFYRSKYDDLVEAFIEKLNEVSKEMAAKIDSKPSAAGINDAQMVFDAKKAELREAFVRFRGVPKSQISDPTFKKLTDSVTNNGKSIIDAFVKHAIDYADEPNTPAKFTKLMKDYTDTISL